MLGCSSRARISRSRVKRRRRLGSARPGRSSFSATRRFRGASYAIEVRNLGAGHGVRALHVDGHLVPGNLIPVFASGEHVVEVEIG